MFDYSELLQTSLSTLGKAFYIFYVNFSSHSHNDYDLYLYCASSLFLAHKIDE